MNPIIINESERYRILPIELFSLKSTQRCGQGLYLTGTVFLLTCIITLITISYYSIRSISLYINSTYQFVSILVLVIMGLGLITLYWIGLWSYLCFRLFKRRIKDNQYVTNILQRAYDYSSPLIALVIFLQIALVIFSIIMFVLLPFIMIFVFLLPSDDHTNDFGIPPHKANPLAILISLLLLMFAFIKAGGAIFAIWLYMAEFILDITQNLIT